MRLNRHRFVYLDEAGTMTNMTCRRCRCLKCGRLRAKAPYGHWKSQTFIAGLRCNGLTAPFVIDVPMNRRIFETYISAQLAPTPKPGDGNLSMNMFISRSTSTSLDPKMS